MKKPKIEIELTNILLNEINDYLVKNESRIDGSGMEIFCAILNVLTLLVAISDYEPEHLVEFIQENFANKVKENRRAND
jgi:hypothetical protein